MDHRGHGHSDKPTEPEDYSLELMAEDAYGLLEHLGIEECYVVGHSMGGVVAQLLALNHPEPVRALVLVDTAAEVPDGYRPQERAPLLDIAREQGMEAVFEEMLRTSPLFSTLAAVSSVFIEKWREQFLLTSVEGYVYCAQAIHGRRPLLDELYRIQVPTLIVCGALDEAFLEASRQMHERIAGSELAIIPGCGHNPIIERAQEFSRIVASFLERVDACLAGR
jgi:3-oxoadipate enol-lactonase